jgi:hypothetical protein
MALVSAIPDDEARESLAAHMRQTVVAWPVIDGLVYEAKRMERIMGLRAHLAKQKRTWSDAVKALVRPAKDFRENGARTPDGYLCSTSSPPPSIKPQIVMRPVERCKSCGSVDPFRKKSGPRNYGNMRVSYARCWRCGQKAHIRAV